MGKVIQISTTVERDPAEVDTQPLSFKAYGTDSWKAAIKLVADKLPG